MRKIFVTGMSGTGKSTLTKEFEKRNIPAFDIDQIIGSCNWYDKTTGKQEDYYTGLGKEWLYNHEWICDFDWIRKRVESYPNEKMVIVAGSTTNQKSFLDYFDQIFLLQLDNETLKDRLTHRTTNDFAQDKSEQEYIIETKDDFEKDMINYGAIVLPATLPTETLADMIVKNIYNPKN